jgi:hypothetical protein
VELQPELPWEGARGQADGLSRWRAGRLAALADLRRRLGLPLGHEVEVELTGGMTLRGRLELEEVVLPADPRELDRICFRVGRVRFRRPEIARCVRLD